MYRLVMLIIDSPSEAHVSTLCVPPSTSSEQLSGEIPKLPTMYLCTCTYNAPGEHCRYEALHEYTYISGVPWDFLPPSRFEGYICTYIVVNTKYMDVWF